MGNCCNSDEHHHPFTDQAFYKICIIQAEERVSREKKRFTVSSINGFAGGNPIVLQLWAKTGAFHESEYDLANEFYREASAIVIEIDSGDPNSLQNIVRGDIEHEIITVSKHSRDLIVCILSKEGGIVRITSRDLRQFCEYKNWFYVRSPNEPKLIESCYREISERLSTEGIIPRTGNNGMNRVFAEESQFRKIN